MPYCTYCGMKILEEEQFCSNCGSRVHEEESNDKISINQDDKVLFDGRYSILKLLGKGGMGKVYLAKNNKLGTLWAIKEIRKETKNKIDFLAETNILKKLNHSTIVKIFDIDEDEDNVYIIEEFVEGISVEDELKKIKSIDEKIVVEWAKQICEALIYIHNLKPNPIIYRDMKPSNIMITKDNKVKIIDFGIAREYKSHADSDTTYIGTRGYAAPEQYGTSQTDARTDVYSLGVTLYHMATGLGPNDPPYEILPIRQVKENLSEGLEYIIGKCTKLNPQERYQSAKQMLDDLNNMEKFNSEYKKRRIISSIKSIVAIIFLVVFSTFIYTGIFKIKQEKIQAYDEADVNITVSQVDSSNFPEIKLYFSVEDDSKQLIKELSSENFELKDENSVNQTITSLKQPNEEQVISTNVVMDISSSMGNGKLNQSKQAAKNFLDIIKFNSGDKVELISFNNDYNVIQHFTDDKNSLINAIENMNSFGDTALYDALHKALLETNNQSGGKCLIAFTDGKDNSSYVTQDFIIDLSKKLGIPIYIIGVGSDVETDILKHISEETGGSYVAISDFSRLEEIYKGIFKKQKEQYVLTYTTQNADANNSWQELQLEITNKNYKGNGTAKFIPKKSLDTNLLVNPEQKYTINQEIIWNQCSKVTNNTLIGITSGNNGFVAVGNNGTIIRSDDGSLWKTSISNVSNTIIAVGCNDNRYVAVGSQGIILTSNDAVNWKTQYSGTSNSLRGITWNGSKFVVVGDGGIILNSYDGENWTRVDSGIATTLYEIVWTGQKFITVGSKGRILSSYDGVSWTTISTNVNNDLIGVTYSGNRFVAVGSSGTILFSDDGTTWFQSSSTTNLTLITVIWAGNRFVAIGKEGVMQTSKNGYTWYRNSTGTYNDLRCMKYNGTNVVAVGNSGTVLISQN